MRKVLPIALMLGLSPALSGCVAAVVPALAAGALGASRVDGDDKVGEKTAAKAEKNASDSPALIASPAISPVIDPVAPKVAPTPTSVIAQPAKSPDTAYSPFADFLSYSTRLAAQRSSGGSASGAVLVPRVDLDDPQTIVCGTKPLAVLIDLDEGDTIPLDSGQSLQPQPGLAATLDSLRGDGVTIIWISDSPVEAKPALQSLLEFAGLSRTRDGDLLMLKSSDEDRKQLRRQQAAGNHCVVALAGDDYDDFDELYDYLLYPEAAAPLDAKFGDGWFLIPPPFVTGESVGTAASLP